MISADDPRITAFLTAWHENRRTSFEREYTNLVYDRYDKKVAKDRKKYIALNRSTVDEQDQRVSEFGVFLVDRETLMVWSTKGYGAPNRQVGFLEPLTRVYEKATALNRPLGSPGYVGADRALLAASLETP